MANGLCDVKECHRKTFMGWRPIGIAIGRQVCEYHWSRHCQNDGFNLFDYFDFPKLPAEDRDFSKQRTVKPEKLSRHCDCGAKILSRFRFCQKCMQERERKRKREYQRKRRFKNAQYRLDDTPIEKGILCCKECGKEREPGHTYCVKCAGRQERKSNRERQRRYRKKHRFATVLT